MLRALMLRKKINDTKKEIEALRANESDFETRAADIQKRTDETAQAIEEAQTEEETELETEESELGETTTESEVESETEESEVEETELETVSC